MFQRLHIHRTGGFMGTDQTLTIGADRVAHIAVQRGMTPHPVDLDSVTWDRLVAAATDVLESRPGPSPTRGADMFHYRVELAADAGHYEVDTVDAGADEQLLALMGIASDLFAQA